MTINVLMLDGSPGGRNNAHIYKNTEPVLGMKFEPVASIAQAKDCFETKQYDVLVTEPFMVTRNSKRLNQYLQFLEETNKKTPVILYSSENINYSINLGLKEGKHYIAHICMDAQQPTIELKRTIDDVLKQ